MNKVQRGLTIRTALISSKPTEIDWAYLAGFYDGEGTVTATRQARSDGFYYQLRFSISNTNYELLRELQSKFGGSIHVGSVVKDKPRYKQIYLWMATSKTTCLPIFYGMLPYLRYKTDEIKLAISYWENMVTPKRGEPLSCNEVYRRSEIVRAIQSLPHRRKYIPTTLPEEVTRMISART